MNWMLKAIAGLVTAAVVMMLSGIPSSLAQQVSPCADRRKQAIYVARQINTLQMRRFQKTKAYQPLNQLTEIVVPEGFTVQLVHSATEYVFSIKDTLAECDLVVFSDQRGLIYMAQPLR